MNQSSFLVVLFVSAGAMPAFSQREAPTTSNSLARVRSVFSTADSNHDGKLAVDEAKSIPVTQEVFRTQDEDKDGLWSEDEFILYFRQRLADGGQTAAPDLEAEVTRIQALRRAKEIEAARKRAQDQGGGQVPGADTQGPGARAARGATTTANEDAIDAQLKTALEELDKRAAAGQPAREEFQKVRNLLVARERASPSAGERAGTDPAGAPGAPSTTFAKMTQALDRLERILGEGKYTKEEYQQLRDMVIHRARAIESGKSAVAETSTASAADAAGIQAGLQVALDNLEKRAAASGATREDFQRVRDLLVARARAAASAGQPDGLGSETYLKMTQALDRIERIAGEGKYSKEEFQQLRDMIIRRARAIEAGKSAVAEPPAPIPTDAAGIQAGLQAALDNLEKRAAAAGATREDFQRVRDHLVARARAAASSSNPGDAGAASSQSYETTLKLLDALTRLEKRAGEGQFPKEEYAQLREQMIHRARVIDTSAPASAPARAKPGDVPPVAGAPREPQPVAPAPTRDPAATPAKPKPAEPAGDGKGTQRPPTPPAPQPAPPQRPAGSTPEKEKPPPQRPPPTPPPSEREKERA